MQKTRPHLNNPIYGEITQGTVFCCAYSNRYSDCDVHGLTITARCDVAQSKFPVLNYLPVVKISDWLRRDGLDILVETETSDQSGRLKRLIRQAGISESLVTALPLREIAEGHFPLNEGSKAQRKTAKEFHELVDLDERFQSLLRDKGPDDQFDWFCAERPKKIEEIIRRLSRHNVPGHYLLERLFLDDNDPSGYVCMLREVTTLPRIIAAELGRGLSQATYESLCASGAPSPLSFLHNDLAMPVVEIGSPTIEHILQSFTNLFGRIGIADPKEEVIFGIVAKNLTVTGETQ